MTDQDHQQPVTPIAPTPVADQPQPEEISEKSSAKKVGFIVGTISLLVLLAVTVLIAGNSNDKLTSDTQAQIEPTPYISITNAPQPLNNSQDLEKVVSELDSENIKAENQIQGTLNEFDMESSQ